MWFGTSNSNSNSQQHAMEEDSQQQPQRRATWTFLHRSNTSRSSAKGSQEESKSASSTAMRNSFIAGLTAGVTGTLVGHPLDSLKVWVQTGQATGGLSSITLPSAKEIPGILRRCYAGVAGPVMTVGLIQSVNFTAYDSMRRYYYKTYDVKDDDNSARTDPQAYLNNDSFTCVAVSGVAAGVVVSVITQPVMMVKTKQQSQNMKFLPAIKHTLRHPLVGFGTHLFAETANRSIYFVTYEGIKRKYVDENGKTPMSVRMIGAMTAGIACWAFIYPSDVIRSRIYAASAAGHDMNAWKMVQVMHAEGGMSSFFRGFGVTLLRAGPVAAVILPVYDVVLGKLNELSA